MSYLTYDIFIGYRYPDYYDVLYCICSEIRLKHTAICDKIRSEKPINALIGYENVGALINGFESES